MSVQDYTRYLIPIAVAAICVAACNQWNHRYPGKEYMPEMVHSLAYETYAEANDNQAFPTGQTALLPPAHAIAIGNEVYDLPNTPEAYQLAATRTENPVPLTDEALARGKEIYTIHCSPCHGTSGNGEGSAVVGSDYNLGAPPIKFNTPEPGYLTPGRMFFTITYGKGMMGSYAPQVSVEDRWNVIHYIHSLNENQTAVTEPTPQDPSTEVAGEETAM